MNMGCCGRSTTALGLLAEADAFPPSHPRGAKARRRIAYSVAAYKAKQAGNREAYARALSGLRGLDLADAASDAAAAQSAMGRLFNLTGNTQFTAALSQAQPVINIVLAAAGLGTGIAASVPGADQNAITAINMVISWIRTLLQGGTPTIPNFDANTLNGFVGFCVWKPTVKGVVDAAFSAAALAAATNSGVSGALNTVRGLIDNVLDGICSIPQIASAVQTGTPGNCSGITNAVWDAAAGGCVCGPGYTASTTVADRCDRIYTPMGTQPVDQNPMLWCWDGTRVPRSVGCPPRPSGGTSGGLLKVALPAAGLLWYFMR